MVSNIDDVSVPFFVGLLLTCILYGITLEQIVLYFSAHAKKTGWHSILIPILLAIDAAHVLFLSISSSYVVFSWRNSARAADVLRWGLPMSFALSYIITFIVRCFYVKRIWKMSWRNKTLSASVGFLNVFQLVTGIVVVAKTARNPILTIDDQLKTCIGIQLFSSLAGDLTVMSSFVYYSRRNRSDLNSMLSTEVTRNRLFTFSIVSGLVTSLVTLINIILFMSSPDNYNWIVPQAISSKLYVISLLASFNIDQEVQASSYKISIPNNGSSILPVHQYSFTRKTEIGNQDDMESASSLAHANGVSGMLEKERTRPVSLTSNHPTESRYDLELPTEDIASHGSRFFEFGVNEEDFRQVDLSEDPKLTLDVSIPSGKISPSPGIILRSSVHSALFSPISPSAALDPTSVVSPRTQRTISWGRMLQAPGRSKTVKSGKSGRSSHFFKSEYSFASSSAFTAHTFNTTRRQSTATSVSGTGARSIKASGTRKLPPLPITMDPQTQPSTEKVVASLATSVVKPLGVMASIGGIQRIAGINAPRVDDTTEAQGLPVTGTDTQVGLVQISAPQGPKYRFGKNRDSVCSSIAPDLSVDPFAPGDANQYRSSPPPIPPLPGHPQ